MGGFPRTTEGRKKEEKRARGSEEVFWVFSLHFFFSPSSSFFLSIDVFISFSPTHTKKKRMSAAFVA